MDVYLLHVIYTLVTAIFSIVGYYIAYKIETKEKKDLLQMFLGTSMISTSFIELTIANDLDNNEIYPYPALVSLVIFTILTFYSFLRESFALLDDALLVKCDIASGPPQITDDSNLTETEIPKFNFWDHFPTFLLFISACLEGGAFGLHIASYNSTSSMNTSLLCMLPIRLIMSFCIARKIKEIHFNGILFTIISILSVSLLVIFGSIPQFVSKDSTNTAFNVFASLLFGCFLYFGTCFIHDSRSILIHSDLMSIIYGALGFAVPVIFRIFIKLPKD